MRKIEKDKYYVCRFKEDQKQYAWIHVHCLTVPPERAFVTCSDQEWIDRLERHMWIAYRVMDFYHDIERGTTINGTYLQSIREYDRDFLTYITWEEEKAS